MLTHLITCINILILIQFQVIHYKQYFAYNTHGPFSAQPSKLGLFLTVPKHSSGLSVGSPLTKHRFHFVELKTITIPGPKTPKPHKIIQQNHVSSETLGWALFTATQLGISSLGSKILIPIIRPSKPQQIPIHKMALSQRINHVGKDPYMLELLEVHKTGAHA